MSKRRVFLIDRKFQLRFSFFVCSWLFALSLAYPMIIYNLFDYFIRYLAVDPNGPALNSLIQTRHSMIGLLVVMQLMFLSVTFLISIFVSHRIAGPLYKLKSYFREAKTGNISPNLRFRKSDHFQDVAAGYNEMAQGIRDAMGRNIESVTRSISRVEQGILHADPEGRKQLEEALQTLRELRERLPQ